MYVKGQAVTVTISDPKNTHSPVTVCRGVIADGEKVIARITDGHPVWHGCEVANSGSVRIQRDWNERPLTRQAESLWRRWGVVQHSRAMRCPRCNTLNVLATPKHPHVCLHCRMQNVQLSN